MTIQIIDSHVGNIYSLQNTLQFLGYTSRVVDEANQFSIDEDIILPGVGAFQYSMDLLREKGFPKLIEKNLSLGRSLLGICLGMQLLMDVSYEMGTYQGLGLVSGSVCPFHFSNQISTNLKIPHMGWNQLHWTDKKEADVFVRDKKSPPFCYFVHSYYVKVSNPDVIMAKTDYGDFFCSFLKKDNIYGVQFHPEKSQRHGLDILRTILSLW